MPIPRIEFSEYYAEPIPDHILDRYEDLGLAKPKASYNYRRVYPRLADVDYPREIPGENEHSEVVFITGDAIQVLGSYEAIKMLIEDLERIWDSGEIED